MNRKYIERQSLLVSVFINFIIGMAGLLVYIVTNLNALLLDGVFSLIAFVSSLAALYMLFFFYYAFASLLGLIMVWQ